jgi:hypothetical protein
MVWLLPRPSLLVTSWMAPPSSVRLHFIPKTSEKKKQKIFILFIVTQSTLIPQGASWKFSSTVPASTWTQLSFDDSAWPISASPFGDSYSTAVSFFGTNSYYFRYSFTVPAGQYVIFLCKILCFLVLIF